MSKRIEPSDLTLRMLRESKSVVVLTGAGISAESGIETFRGKDGVWSRFNVDDLATPEAFERDPKFVWEWFDSRRELLTKLKPNPAHHTVAEMENYYEEFHLITQNIDGLHQRAGSKDVVELHGSIWRVKCLKEGRSFENYEAPFKELPPRCECGSILRPDVVFFREPLPFLELTKAFDVSGKCEVMIVIGTSAVVQPAASLPLIAKENGAYLIEVNLEESQNSPIMDECFFGKAGEILPELWRMVKESV